MSWELYYTSADRGLRPHSRGFCTVARTDAMPAAVVERLESLSSYQPIHPGGSPLADQNPIAWSHWKIPVGARTRSVLSRVAFVRSDYIGRPSKFAHHLLLEPGEQSPAGPAAMMLSHGMMLGSWTGEPRLLPQRSLPQTMPILPPDAIRNPGLASRLAQSYQEQPDTPVYIVYDPSIDLLAVLNDGIALLPIAQRWQVTFSTYFTELPAGLSCAWRCVVPGTPAAAAARAANGTVIDLTESRNSAK
jgi:hypothetical protein